MRGHMVVLNEKTKTMPKTEKEKENKTNTRVCLLKFVHTEADATTTKWIGTVYNKAINIEFEEEARREEKKEKKWYSRMGSLNDEWNENKTQSATTLYTQQKLKFIKQIQYTR